MSIALAEFSGSGIRELTQHETDLVSGGVDAQGVGTVMMGAGAIVIGISVAFTPVGGAGLAGVAVGSFLFGAGAVFYLYG